MENLLLTGAAPAAPIRLADLFAVNDFTPEERDVVTADLEAHGFHSGGGGAAGTWHIGTEAGLRIAAALETVAIFKQWLKPAEWAKCEAGEDDPDSFCDSNEAVAEAFEDVFGYEPASHFGEPGEALALSRMNAAVRLATALMLGGKPTLAQRVEIVTPDDSHGLQIVGGGRNLRAVVAEFMGPIS